MPHPRLTRWLAGATLLAVACTPASTGSSGGAAPPSLNEDSITLAYPTNLPTMDPHVFVSQTAYWAGEGIFDQLLRYDRTGKLVPWLATEWKSSDGQVWTFTMRPGVKFSNGEAWDANVAKWNIDREAIAKSLFRGLHTPAGQLVTPSGNGYDANLKPYPLDVKKAKELMAAAGYPNGGFKMRGILAAGGRPFKEAVAGDWKELGVEAELTVLELGAYSERYRQDPIDEMFTSRSSDGSVRDGVSTWQSALDGQRVWQPQRVSWKNDKFFELYAAQAKEPDKAKRDKIMLDIAKIVYDEIPVVPVYHQNVIYLHAPKVQGLFAFPDTSVSIMDITKQK